ncbi:MAG: archaellin/type IV pilin N-terminal domain-containing protein [Nitrososphaerota archaeon]|nr:archaellin/type IV pilin N-terminal domain-containing protein [Nitrososphaerota archaeon]
MQRVDKKKRGMVGVEAAIILIAFVIVAAAFSFMVVNMGLFATQRGRDTISQGVQEASTPLTIDGSILIKGQNTTHINAIVLPLKTLGVKYVPMANETTVVTLRIANKTAYANIYYGINSTSTQGKTYTELLDGLNQTKTLAMLFIENSNGDESLNSQEKGYLIIKLSDNDCAQKRDQVFIEIRPESGAPLSIEFVVPSELSPGWMTLG